VRPIFLLLTIWVMAAASPVAAQVPPPPKACNSGSAMDWVRGREVEAPVYNTGSLFWRDRGSPRGYTDRNGKNQLLAASFWLGAQFDGFLFMAGSMLGPWEFWPGPLDEDGLPLVDCTPYDRIFEITRQDIQEYEATGIAVDNLANWPFWAGAPVLDGDGNPDNYELGAGDRPALLGDRLLWWVMNDAAGLHVASQAIPLHAQVQVSAFTFDLPGVLGRSTFYRYRIKRFGIFPLVQAHMGLFVYAGLGDVFDDYVGADSTLSMGYVYNADDDDVGGYGEAPPAVGIGILRGAGLDVDDSDESPTSQALAARKMTSYVAYQALCEDCNPYPNGPGAGFYDMMRGRWPWGDQVSLGPSFGGPVTTPIMYPGPPGEFWSELNLDGAGTAAAPGDRKMVVASGPFTLVPEEVYEIVFAVVTSRGADHLDSVRQLKEDMSFVRDQTASILTPNVPSERRDLLPESPILGVSGAYPNPASGPTRFEFSLPETMTFRLEIFDMLGRRLAVPASGSFPAGSHVVNFDTSGWPGGVYLYRATANRFSATGRMVVSR
jgi:type IX secretion system substrate protein